MERDRNEPALLTVNSTLLCPIGTGKSIITWILNEVFGKENSQNTRYVTKTDYIAVCLAEEHKYGHVNTIREHRYHLD